MKKILIVGDSLGMVRPDEGILIEDIYPYLLQKALSNDFFVINASQRANNSSRIISKDYAYEHIDATKPDIVILQIGIVDCTPRLFTEIQKKIMAGITLISWLKPVISKYIKKKSQRRYDLTKKREIVHVPLGKFEVNLVNFFEKIKSVSPDATFIVINILYPGSAMTSRNFGLVENVMNYNQKLTGIATSYSSKIIDIFNFTQLSPEVVLTDGHHIGKKAHQFIAQEALKAIQKGDFT